MTEGKILVVDDNPVNQRLAQLTLRVAGYDVRVAADAYEALAVTHEFRPELILMDIQLPGIDGLELTGRIKADPSTADIRVIALTAYAMKGDEARATKAGCDGYMTKPIDTRALPLTVAACLAGGSTAGR
ncbi:MAG: hypothetical protein QOF51_3222 [Chloroflexota bacterium]|jgi:CheY-like chemotaxis protein|nr:hypothetical protein [Chloroflexota bacterium]